VNLKGQHLGRLFTFLAGLIILAHAVVPHHHHYEPTHASVQESSCENHTHEKSSEDPFAHCHAFNVLIAERTLISSLNQFFSDFFIFYLAGINVELVTPSVKDISAIIFGYPVAFIDQYLSFAQSLRAPPLV
jgi:hypothetical protein